MVNENRTSKRLSQRSTAPAPSSPSPAPVLPDPRIDTLRDDLEAPRLDVRLEAVIRLPDDAIEAAPILEEALDGSELTLRVALLDALYRLRGDSAIAQELIAIMDSPPAQGDDGEELYMMARLALNRIEGDGDDVISGEVEPQDLIGFATADASGKLAVVIHGTWAKQSRWWRRGGDFYSYLKDKLGLRHLYDGDVPFTWSGKHRNRSRRGAARALKEWVRRHNPSHLEIYAHSYGANISMLATHAGLHIHKLVMMSPPVCRDYFPLWEEIDEAFNIQASFDPVVALSRSDRWFDLPQVRELALVHSGHGASRDPIVWEQNQVPAFLGLR